MRARGRSPVSAARSSGLSSGPAGFAILVGFSPGAHEWMPLM
jgi:hypothetical protein